LADFGKAKIGGKSPVRGMHVATVRPGSSQDQGAGKARSVLLLRKHNGALQGVPLGKGERQMKLIIKWDTGNSTRPTVTDILEHLEAELRECTGELERKPRIILTRRLLRELYDDTFMQLPRGL